MLAEYHSKYCRKSRDVADLGEESELYVINAAMDSGQGCLELILSGWSPDFASFQLYFRCKSAIFELPDGRHFTIDQMLEIGEAAWDAWGNQTPNLAGETDPKVE